MPLFSLRPAATLWPPVLLGSQFVFNIGFYAVVPFLALFLRDDMLLSGGLIGLILGLRTFSQQGMFILGGTLADRYGAKAIILAGCVVRVAGFLLLACGASLWPIILGACLTGVGGALFSPSIEALLARAGTHSQANGKRSRAEWFALFAVCGELGAVIGPVAGGVLSGIGFRHIALAGAGIFLLALAVLFFCLTADDLAELTLLEDFKLTEEDLTHYLSKYQGKPLAIKKLKQIYQADLRVFPFPKLKEEILNDWEDQAKEAIHYITQLDYTRGTEADLIVDKAVMDANNKYLDEYLTAYNNY